MSTGKSSPVNRTSLRYQESTDAFPRVSTLWKFVLSFEIVYRAQRRLLSPPGPLDYIDFSALHRPKVTLGGWDQARFDPPPQSRKTCILPFSLSSFYTATRKKIGCAASQGCSPYLRPPVWRSRHGVGIMTFSYNPNLVKTRWPPMIVSSIGLRKGAGPWVMHNTRIYR